MLRIDVDEIGVNADLDHGEGCIVVVWKDEMSIQRTLKVDIDGFCSRDMPIRSGRGLIDASLGERHLKLEFTSDLGKNLELDTIVELRWTSLNCEPEHLEAFIDHLAIEANPPNNT